MRSKMTHVMEENQLLLRTVRPYTALNECKNSSQKTFLIIWSMFVYAHLHAYACHQALHPTP